MLLLISFWIYIYFNDINVTWVCRQPLLDLENRYKINLNKLYFTDKAFIVLDPEEVKKSRVCSVAWLSGFILIWRVLLQNMFCLCCTFSSFCYWQDMLTFHCLQFVNYLSQLVTPQVSQLYWSDMILPCKFLFNVYCVAQIHCVAESSFGIFCGLTDGNRLSVFPGCSWDSQYSPFLLFIPNQASALGPGPFCISEENLR